MSWISSLLARSPGTQSPPCLPVYPTRSGEVCTECVSCEDACPTGAVVLGPVGPRIDLSLCDGCGDCMRACPADVLVPSEETASCLN